jgi:hypothetical protein
MGRLDRSNRGGVQWRSDPLSTFGRMEVRHERGARTARQRTAARTSARRGGNAGHVHRHRVAGDGGGLRRSRVRLAAARPRARRGRRGAGPRDGAGCRRLRRTDGRARRVRRAHPRRPRAGRRRGGGHAAAAGHGRPGPRCDGAPVLPAPRRPRGGHLQPGVPVRPRPRRPRPGERRGPGRGADRIRAGGRRRRGDRLDRRRGRAVRRAAGPEPRPGCAGAGHGARLRGRARPGSPRRPQAREGVRPAGHRRRGGRGEARRALDLRHHRLGLDPARDGG